MIIHESSAFTGTVLGVFEAALPLDYRPSIKIVGCQSGKNPLEIYLAVSQGTKPSRPFYPGLISPINALSTIRIKLRILDMKHFDSFVVVINKGQIIELLKQKITALGVSHLFEVTLTEIRSRNGNGIIIFQGMQDHTADSIKSLEGFDRAWVEEAQNLSARSLELLRPTIRNESSEIWFSWNPDQPDDPVDKFFADRPKAGPEASGITRMNGPCITGSMRQVWR